MLINTVLHNEADRNAHRSSTLLRSLRILDDI